MYPPRKGEARTSKSEKNSWRLRLAAALCRRCSRTGSNEALTLAFVRSTRRVLAA